MAVEAPFKEPDFSQTTQPRVMGSETEYAIQAERIVGLDKVSQLQPRTAYLSDTSNEIWTSNGGRLYYEFDYGKSPSTASIAEFATPECRSAEEVMLHEKVGEEFVRLIGDATWLESYGVIPLYDTFKRTAYTNVTNKDNALVMSAMSLGHHENYSTSLSIFDPKTRSALVSYLATRPTWAGAGMATPDGYVISQKASGILYSHSATQSQVLTEHGRKIPFRQKGQRSDYIEIRVGDGNMSPWAIRTKFAMTSLVLRLVEHGAFPEDALLYDDDCVNRAARLTGIHPNKAFGITGAPRNGTSHQRRIAQAGLDFAEANEIPAEEVAAALDVLTVCDQVAHLADDPTALEPLAERVDWAAKFMYIKRTLGTSSCNFAAYQSRIMQAVQHDLLWEALGENGPSGKHYTKTGNVADPAALERARMTPPATRAAYRTEQLKDMDREGILGIVDGVHWTCISFLGHGEPIDMPTPYIDYS